jgi:hypothetical protein
MWTFLPAAVSCGGSRDRPTTILGVKVRQLFMHTQQKLSDWCQSKYKPAVQFLVGQAVDAGGLCLHKLLARDDGYYSRYALYITHTARMFLVVTTGGLLQCVGQQMTPTCRAAETANWMFEST